MNIRRRPYAVLHWLTAAAIAVHISARRGTPFLLLCVCLGSSAPLPARALQPTNIPRRPAPFGAVTQQQNGFVAQMPVNYNVSRDSGLSLSIDTRWMNNYGYRPVDVAITSPVPTKTDRLITIRIHCNSWSSQRGSITVEQDFELLQGSTTATAAIAFPQYQLAGQSYWWDVWIDGKKDKDLSRERDSLLVVSGSGMGPGGGNGLAVLAVGPRGQQRSIGTTSAQGIEIMTMPISDFPRRWIDYTCFDVVSLSRAELQALVAQPTPNSMSAIRHWVEAGGQVWINDAGANWEHIPAIAGVFGVATVIAGVSEVPSEQPIDAGDELSSENPLDDVNNEEEPPKQDPPGAAWLPVRFGTAGPLGRVVTFLDLKNNTTRVERDQATIEQLQSDPNFAITNQEFQQETEPTRRRWPRDSRRAFVDHPLGLGVVRAFRGNYSAILSSAGAPNAFLHPNSGEEFASRPTSPLALALRATRRWDARHGMKPDDANLDFPRLLVPGVGLAPVTEFRVLITLFVVLIGPVNYWLLKRVGKLYLLVLTVPLAAAVLTSSLFAYALLSDGFGTTVRAQSLTTLDQQTGNAACWSRLSYYSGLAPSQGLVMPDDLVLYPIIPGWNDADIDASVGASRELVWENEQAKLTRGWLRSRTPMQYLAIRSRQSPSRLELTPAAEQIRAVNNLGTAIRFVLVIDSENKLFTGENLAPESKAVLLPIERADAIRRLRKLFTDHTPEAPPALSGDTSTLPMTRRGRSRRLISRQFGLQYSEQRLDANLLNDALAELTGLNGQPALNLPPQSYVAITESGPEVALGIPEATEEASFHVIIGRW